MPKFKNRVELLKNGLRSLQSASISYHYIDTQQAWYTVNLHQINSIFTPTDSSPVFQLVCFLKKFMNSASHGIWTDPKRLQ